MLSSTAVYSDIRVRLNACTTGRIRDVVVNKGPDVTLPSADCGPEPSRVTRYKILLFYAKIIRIVFMMSYIPYLFLNMFFHV